jgi:hypothetical protein
MMSNNFVNELKIKNQNQFPPLFFLQRNDFPYIYIKKKKLKFYLIFHFFPQSLVIFFFFLNTHTHTKFQMFKNCVRNHKSNGA